MAAETTPMRTLVNNIERKLRAEELRKCSLHLVGQILKKNG